MSRGDRGTWITIAASLAVALALLAYVIFVVAWPYL